MLALETEERSQAMRCRGSGWSRQWQFPLPHRGHEQKTKNEIEPFFVSKLLAEIAQPENTAGVEARVASAVSAAASRESPTESANSGEEQVEVVLDCSGYTTEKKITESDTLTTMAHKQNTTEPAAHPHVTPRTPAEAMKSFDEAQALSR